MTLSFLCKSETKVKWKKYKCIFLLFSIFYFFRTPEIFQKRRSAIAPRWSWSQTSQTRTATSRIACRSCATGRTMKRGWRSSWASWPNSSRRTVSRPYTRTTPCYTRSHMSSVRPSPHAMPTYASKRLVRVGFYSFIPLFSLEDAVEILFLSRHTNWFSRWNEAWYLPSNVNFIKTNLLELK